MGMAMLGTCIVVNQMDMNNDDNVTQAEILLFFADLMGTDLSNVLDLDALLALDNDLLLQMAAGLSITKHDFTHAWHNKYHDSMEFIGATFDALEAIHQDNDGALDADEIEAIINHALTNFDANGDGSLERTEAVAYLEHAQSHGGGQTNLHGICHSNHQQMNEDQVIQTIVRQMDANSDGSVTKPELLLFFADLMGVNRSMDTSALNDTELLEMAAGLSITKHDFTQAWHNRFHDSVEFIGATFDALEGQNKDGTLDANEIEAIVNDALMNYGVSPRGSQAQSHGGGQANLHGICHSNHRQMNEDQVIQTVVRQMDANSDGSVTKPELLLFFADLMGVNRSMDTSALNDTELLEIAAGLSITKHDFTQAWHNRFHDSMEFIGATFDALEAIHQNNDGALDADDIEAIVNDAVMNYGQ
nr:hypothetical protein BaRGS_007772 [Batillaria attramentaria]